MDYGNVYLPKWPGLLVIGDPVTKDQAREIIVRTQKHFDNNNREEEKELARLIGRPLEEDYMPRDTPFNREKFSQFWEAQEKFKEEYGLLDLEYLYNGQICSLYIHGFYGWANWDGEIFSAGRNVGKYPSVEEIREDWQKVATAFPYLKLNSWLLSEEFDEEHAKPVVEFRLDNGHVDVITNSHDFTHCLLRSEPTQQQISLYNRSTFGINQIPTEDAVNAFIYVKDVLAQRKNINSR